MVGSTLNPCLASVLLMNRLFGAATLRVFLRYSYHENFSSSAAEATGGLSARLLRSQNPGGKMSGDDWW